MIALIDYKAGNLTSVRKALAAVGADVFTPDSPADLAKGGGIIVPGVGHFAATAALDRAWKDTITGMIADGKPLLGICLGMQWLFEGSDESPELEGLGLLPGRCYRLGRTASPPAGAPGPGESLPQTVKIPHVGWNTLDMRRAASIADGVPSGSQVYFTHSYVAPLTGDTVASTEHGEAFASIVERGLVAGVQFHPEKSGDVGLHIVRNFLSRVA